MRNLGRHTGFDQIDIDMMQGDPSKNVHFHVTVNTVRFNVFFFLYFTIWVILYIGEVRPQEEEKHACSKLLFKS